jgi:hypothetical protein
MSCPQMLVWQQPLDQFPLHIGEFIPAHHERLGSGC